VARERTGICSSAPEVKKRAFLVIGAENSGNRMMRKCLCTAGCWGDPDREEFTDDLNFEGLPEQIAVARSVPHGEFVPDVKAIARLMQLAGYQVVPILVYRKTDFAVAGQVKVYQRSPEEARRYIEVAARLAYECALWLKTVLVVVPYELFVTSAWVRDHLFLQLGLPPTTHELFNANEKYELEGSPLPY